VAVDRGGRQRPAEENDGRRKRSRQAAPRDPMYLSGEGAASEARRPAPSSELPPSAKPANGDMGRKKKKKKKGGDKPFYLRAQGFFPPSVGSPTNEDNGPWLSGPR